MGIVTVRDIPFTFILLIASIFLIGATFALADPKTIADKAGDGYGFVEPVVVASRGGKVMTEDICFYVLDKKSYQEVANSCADDEKIEVAEGEYVLRTVYDKVSAEQNIKIKSGALNRPLVNLGIGFVTINSSSDGQEITDTKDIWHYVFDSSGKKRIVGIPPLQDKFAIKSGKYLIVTKRGDAEVKTSFMLKPGEKLKLDIVLP